MKKSKASLCSTALGENCFKVEAVISVDERGQMVLPKELREKTGIKTGEKLALISFESRGKVCCLGLVKADDFADMVKGVLGPVFKDIVK